MPSLPLIIFVLQLAIHIVNSLGAATVNELLWLLYSKLPTSTSRSAARIDTQRREVFKLKRQMNSTSAQDEFSKWAKLRRQHDKANADYEKNAAAIKSTRATFDMIASTLRWVGLKGGQFLIQLYYQRQPVYWIPRGWLPYYMEWILSFPRAPVGSISVQVWWAACASAILLVGDAVVAVYTLVNRQAIDQKAGVGNGRTPMAFPADQSSGAEEKKEL